MKTITKTCNRIQQTTGGEYQTFNDINNLKVVNNYYAQTELIKGKNGLPNRPALLLLSDFRFNLPAGARVRNIKIIYQHMKIGLNPETIPSIGRPTINILNVPSGLKANSQFGQGPTTSNRVENLNFSCDLNASVVNNDKFAVQFRYPPNANDKQGYLRVYNIKVELSYVLPEFSLELNKTKGTYNGEEFEITAKISNLNATTFIPWCTINIPVGFNLESFETNGEVNQISARMISWYPKIYGISSDTIVLKFSTNITYTGTSTSYTGTFDISEALNSTYRSLSVTVIKPDESKKEAEVNDEQVVPNEDMLPVDPVLPYTPPNPNGKVGKISVVQGKYFNIYLGLNAEEMANTGFDYQGQGQAWILSVYNNTEFTKNDFRNETERMYWVIRAIELNSDGYIIKRFYQNLLQDTTLILWSGQVGSSQILRRLDYEIVPNNSNPPFTNIFEPSQEEKNRMGHGYTYTVQSFLRRYVMYETFPYDWRHNFRIGVFNTPISGNVTVYEYTDEEGEIHEVVHDSTDYDNLTMAEIFENAVWSKMATGENPLVEYESLDVSFVYNKNCPLYILITGGYHEHWDGATQTVRFTEPVIIETGRYNGPEETGIYPVPILATLDASETAEETIPAFASASDLIYYDFPLEDDYGTNEEYAVQGIEVTGNIEKADELIFSAKLISPSGESRTRTVVVSDYEIHSTGSNSFSIGGFGDLWGFSTLDIVHLEDWEVELNISNTLNPSESTIIFNNVQITFYVVDVGKNIVRTYINGEDLSYYGIFLRDVKVPEGLNTDTDYLTVNGTDLNNPYRQAIREKKLELEFDIGESCQILDNTQALRRLASLLVNRRDQYNKPIPNVIQFSHYPDVYWEYILEDALNNELDINTYTVKVKLTIPDGTAYGLTETTTSNYGYVDGLAHINPVLLIKPTGANMSITETVTGQTFNIGFSDYENYYIQIDCKNRKAWLKTDPYTDVGIDISKYVDLNSDWFRILGEYSFISSNCVISTIKYRERW